MLSIYRSSCRIFSRSHELYNKYNMCNKLTIIDGANRQLCQWRQWRYRLCHWCYCQLLGANNAITIGASRPHCLQCHFVSLSPMAPFECCPLVPLATIVGANNFIRPLAILLLGVPYRLKFGRWKRGRFGDQRPHF